MHWCDAKPLPAILYGLAIVLLHLSECAELCDLYNNNGGVVNITSRQATPHYGIRNSATNLYCQADNFCQIDWYRNGVPRDGFKFLWNFTYDFQQNHMALKDDNQTLNFGQTNCDAEANWTCAVSGHNESLNNTIELVLKDYPYKFSPIFMANDECQNISSKFGERIEWFCQCTSGDVTQDVSIEWFKWVESVKQTTTTDDKGSKETMISDDRGQWVPISELDGNGTRYTLSLPQINMESFCSAADDESPTIGQSLIINQLTERELGVYRVVATRQDDSKYKGLNTTLALTISKYKPPASILDNSIAVGIGVSLAGVVSLLLIGGLIWQRKGVDIRLTLKDRYGKTENNDGKRNDAFIAYSESEADINLVVNILKQALQDANYILFIRDIDAIPGETLVEQLISSLENSRRCILVISPDFLNARHSALQLEVAIDQMLRHESKIIPLVFKSVKQEDIKKLRGLDRILSALRYLRWDDSKEAKNDKVLKQLMLRMPPINCKRTNLQLPLSSRNLQADELNLISASPTSASVTFDLPTVPTNNGTSDTNGSLAVPTNELNHEPVAIRG